MPQHLWHEKSRINLYLHIEEAQEYFNQYYPYLEIKMPHELKREHPTWQDVRAPELTELVNTWAGDDFKLYGYFKDESSYR